MSLGISPDSLDIFLELTLKKYDRKRYVNITAQYHRNEFFERFMAGNKVPEEGGAALAWKARVARINNTRLTQLYDTDQSDVANGFKGAEVKWSMQTTNYTYDVREPGLQGGDLTEIIDIMGAKESEMYEGWADFMFEKMWSLPAVGAEPADLYGVPYWLVKNSSSTAGFNGGHPSGYSDVAGISRTTYPNWKNWTFTYTLNTYTRTDIVRKTVEAIKMCYFAPPPKVDGYTGRPRWQMYTTWSVVEALEELAEQRNDNLKKELGFMDGTLTIMGVPLTWNDVLDGGRGRATLGPLVDTTNPIYGVDWNQFSLRFRKGHNSVRTGPEKVADAHNQRRVFVDNTCQFKYMNPSSGFVGYGV